MYVSARTHPYLTCVLYIYYKYRLPMELVYGWQLSCMEVYLLILRELQEKQTK